MHPRFAAAASREVARRNVLRVISLNRKFRVLQSGHRGKEFRRVVSGRSDAAEYLMERLQFQVARGKKLCKAVSQNLGRAFMKIGRAGNGRMGISANGQFLMSHDGDGATGVALSVLADDLVTKRIGTVWRGG
jgi:hypothetical protein